MSCFKAASSMRSPSRMSIARLVLPSRLELKSLVGSLSDAPRAKVSLTTCLYDSPVQTIPSWDQTGVPRHFHSSRTPGSATWMSRRTRARTAPRQSPSSWIRLVMFADAESPSGPGAVVLAAVRRIVTSAAESAGFAMRNQDGHLLQPRMWGPHAIRRAAATMVADAYGLEAGQALLDHQSIDTTRRAYVRVQRWRLLERARQILDLGPSPITGLADGFHGKT